MRRTFIMIPVVFLAVQLLSCNDQKKPETNNQSTTVKDLNTVDNSDISSDSTTQAPEVIAYYFHSTRRCVSCKKIEAYSKEAIESGFEKELANGELAFYSINIDKPEYKYFIEDYQLYTKSLIICDMKNGKQTRWKNLSKIWQLLHNKQDFLKYVQDEITAYMKGS